MPSTLVEATRRSLFVRTSVGTAWAERLGCGATPAFPHPEGRRWGWCVEDGELLIYLGPLHLILTAPTRLDTTGAVTAPSVMAHL